MAKVSPAFTNFSAGEFSPKLDGRVDLQKYTQAAKKLQNMTVQPQGGVARRPGTIFVREVKNSAHNARLIPFQFNVEQSYILEFGDNYFRIHKDGGTVVSSGSPVEITTPYGHDELADLKFTQSNDLMFVSHNSHAPRKITRTSHTAWTVSEIDFVRGPFLDPNTTATTLTANGRTGSVTISASADTFASTDVGRLVKLHHGFAKITAFTNATTVTATVQANEAGTAELTPVYAASTISFHEGDPSATGAEHNDRLQDTAGGFADAGFEAGMQVSVTGSTSNNVSNVLIAQVTATTMLLEPGADLGDEAAASGHTVTGDLVADKNFQLGAFSNTTGFPSQVALHEQRLIFANTTLQPRTIFFSKSGDFENFNPGTADADPLTFTLASDQANEIRYLQPGRHLQVGTSGGEFTVTSTNEGPLTPTTTQILKQGTYGSSKVQPITIGNATLFTQRAKRKIREFVFDLSSDSYQAPDMTLLAEHITSGGIKEMAYQQEPDNVLWVALDNGKLAALTYRREEGVVAWHSHMIGGHFTECTVTVTDYANIAVGTTLKFTKSDGTLVTFTSETAGSSAPSSSTGFRPNTNNDTTADNIFTTINAHADFTVANPAANVVTIRETSPSAGGLLTVVSSDTTRLATTDESNAVVESVACVPGDLDEDDFYMVVKRNISGLVSDDDAISLQFTCGSTQTTFPIDGASVSSGTATFSHARQVTFFNDNNASPGNAIVSGLNLVLTIAGTNADGASQTETINLDQNAATYTSTNFFKTVTSVTINTAPTNFNIKIGIAAVLGTRKYVEYLSNYDFGTDASGAFFVDSGLTYSGSSANTISGLDHLEGEVVSILTNGAAHNDKTVSSGSISLDVTATNVHIGLPYKSVVQTMRIDAGSQQGTAQGKIKRIHDMTVRFHKTVGAKVGTSETELDSIQFRTASDEMDQALDLFDGDKDIEFRGGYEQDAHIVIVQDQPLPMTVIGLFPRLITFDE